MTAFTLTAVFSVQHDKSAMTGTMKQLFIAVPASIAFGYIGLHQRTNVQIWISLSNVRRNWGGLMYIQQVSHYPIVRVAVIRKT